MTRQGRLATPETLRKLQAKLVDMPPKPDVPVSTPSSGGYGLGWSTVPLPFSPEPFGPEANEALMVIAEGARSAFGAAF